MIQVLLTLIVPLASYASPYASILGTWSLTSSTCSSGAPFKPLGPTMTATVGMTSTFAKAQVRSDFQITTKLEQPYADNVIKQALESMAAVHQKPASKARTKTLDELSQFTTVIGLYKAGLSCTTKEVDAYTFDGEHLHSGPVIRRKSTCPGDESHADQPMSIDSIANVDGDVLTITDAAPEANEGAACPVGDRATNTFKRVK